MSDPKGINRRLAFNVTDALVNRFWSRVDKCDPSDCWDWKAAMRNGYGAIKHEGRVLSAHRVAYILTNGEPDENLIIGHKCDNRQCCNPSHLEAITPGTNNRDARGRSTFHMTKGEDCGNSVLNENIVREIRRLRKTGMYGVAISRKLGLNKSTVYGVITGRTWAHVTSEQIQ